MSKKLLVLLSVLMLMVVPFATANAQDVAEGIDYCAILPEADCQILVQSDAVMADVSSLSFDLSLAYDIAMGDSSPGMENINFSIDGNGSVAFDTDVINEVNELAMNDMAAYFEQMPMLLDKLFSAVEGEMSLTITLPEMMAMMMDGAPSELPLNLVMENGVYAIDVATLSAALGEDAGGMTWVGLDLNGAFEAIMSEMDLSSMFNEDMMGMMNMNSADMTSAFNITRLPDSSLNDQSVAVFEIIIDYGELLSSMGMADTLSEMYSDMDMSQEEIDAVMGMLEGMQINMRQYVGLDDFYTYRMEFMMDFEMNGETMGDPSMGTVGFGFDMTMDMNAFNVPVDVTVPADAQIFPFEMLMGSGL